VGTIPASSRLRTGRTRSCPQSAVPELPTSAPAFPEPIFQPDLSGADNEAARASLLQFLLILPEWNAVALVKPPALATEVRLQVVLPFHPSYEREVPAQCGRLAGTLPVGCPSLPSGSGLWFKEAGMKRQRKPGTGSRSGESVLPSCGIVARSGSVA